MTRRAFLWTASLLPARGAVADVGHQQTARGPVRRIGLDLPPTPERVIIALGQLSIQNGTPIGLEIVVAAPQPRDRTPAPQPTSLHYYDLAGLATPQALDAVVSYKFVAPVEAYEWTVDDAVFHVRPRTFRNSRTVALNRTVPTFSLKAADAMEALHGLHRIFDPAYPARPVKPLTSIPAAVEPHVTKDMELSRDGRTVRAILDDIARHYGAAMWIAKYFNVSGAYPGLEFTLVGFERWQLTARSRLR